MRGLFKLKNSVTALVAVTLFFCACNKPQKADNNTAQNNLKVAVSGHAAYSIAREVLKDIADISMLIPPGVEAHSFEPAPKNALDIQKADFFFFISERLEPWAMQISNKTGIALAYDLPDNKRLNDAHVWMSFNNTAVMANTMAAHIARKHPDLEGRLLQNVSAFNRELQMLDRLFKGSLAHCESRTIYHIGHSAFGFFALNYNLEFKPLIGSSFGSEPSPKEMAAMIKEIKEKNIPFIFSEEALSPRLAQTIAAETGAQILLLNSIEHITKQQFEEGLTYKQLMVENADTLRKGLQCVIE